MSSVTVDQLSPSVSFEYAKLTEMAEMAPLAIRETPWVEIATVLAKLSEFQKLFDFSPATQTWGHFAPPPNFYTQLNRFFRASLSPLFTREMVSEIREMVETREGRLEGLCDALTTINKWLEEIEGRKLQYTKG